MVNLCNKASKKFAPLKHFSMMKTFTFFDIILASDIDTLMLDDAQLVEPDVCLGPKEANRAYIYQRSVPPLLLIFLRSILT